MIPNSQTPTPGIADALQRAFDFYNGRLFGGTLPQCVLLLHRKPRSLGYFWPERWKSTTEGEAHELALNPDHVHARPIDDTLSTLVHEMVHLQQEVCGEPGRRGYHNREWADLMEKVGLIPSDTGLPGGKRTGSRMTHYIETGGRFAEATKELLATGWALEWGSFVPPAPEEKKSGRRTKYACQTCDVQVWGKDGLALRCDDCGLAMGVAE